MAQRGGEKSAAVRHTARIHFLTIQCITLNRAKQANSIPHHLLSNPAMTKEFAVQIHQQRRESEDSQVLNLGTPRSKSPTVQVTLLCGSVVECTKPVHVLPAITTFALEPPKLRPTSVMTAPPSLGHPLLPPRRNEDRERTIELKVVGAILNIRKVSNHSLASSRSI